MIYSWIKNQLTRTYLGGFSGWEAIRSGYFVVYGPLTKQVTNFMAHPSSDIAQKLVLRWFAATKALVCARQLGFAPLCT